MSPISRQSALEFELIWERVAISNCRRGEQMRDAISFRQVTRLEIVFTNRVDRNSDCFEEFCETEDVVMRVEVKT